MRCHVSAPPPKALSSLIAISGEIPAWQFTRPERCLRLTFRIFAASVTDKPKGADLPANGTKVNRVVDQCKGADRVDSSMTSDKGDDSTSIAVLVDKTLIVAVGVLVDNMVHNHNLIAPVFGLRNNFISAVLDFCMHFLFDPGQ